MGTPSTRDPSGKLPFAPPPESVVAGDDNPQSRSVKCKFTQEEDEKLKMLVLTHGTSSWAFIARLMGSRNQRQCRERWKNYVNPALRNDLWTLEEDQLLVDRYAAYGAKWNKIAKFFVNRSDNSIRNRWQLMLRKWDKQNQLKPDSSNSAREEKVTQNGMPPYGPFAE
jgi:hypothetical protein